MRNSSPATLTSLTTDSPLQEDFKKAWFSGDFVWPNQSRAALMFCYHRICRTLHATQRDPTSGRAGERATNERRAQGRAAANQAAARREGCCACTEQQPSVRTAPGMLSGICCVCARTSRRDKSEGVCANQEPPPPTVWR